MRTFIALELPEKIRKEIQKIQKELPEFDGKLTEEENLHLTLKFLGELDDKQVEEVKKRLRKINFEKFEVNLKHIGFFDNQKYGVIWIHLSNCEKLQKEVDNILKDFFKSEYRFMAHLTIARVKKIKDKKKFLEELKNVIVNKLSFEVNDFKLKKSTLGKNGPVYEDIEVYESK